MAKQEIKTLNTQTLYKLVETKRKAAEEAARAKDFFLANMSHEIRTPINAVNGLAELIIRTPDNIKLVVEDASEIKQAGNNLLAIINDILDFSKLESGKFELIPDNYGLSSVINDIVNIGKARLIDKCVSLLVYVDSKLPSELFGDEMRIRQIIINFLSNAVKFTKSGFITITFSGKKLDKDNILLNISVKDTGQGIKPEDIKHLFSSFTQVDGRRNKSIEGTGLGLAISKSFCEMMNGKISVESIYGEGSTFSVSIPQKVISETPIAHVPTSKNYNILAYNSIPEVLENICHEVKSLEIPCTSLLGSASPPL